MQDRLPNGVASTTHLISRIGAKQVSFTLGGLQCMSKWFDLSKPVPDGTVPADLVVSGTWPACSDAPPDLSVMGGGLGLWLLGTQLNLLRDAVLNEGGPLVVTSAASQSNDPTCTWVQEFPPALSVLHHAKRVQRTDPCPWTHPTSDTQDAAMPSPCPFLARRGPPSTCTCEAPTRRQMHTCMQCSESVHLQLVCLCVVM